MKILDKRNITLTLEIIIAVLLGIEIAIPPNPHTTHIIIALTLYICLKNDIPQLINDTLTKWFFNWKE